MSRQAILGRTTCRCTLSRWSHAVYIHRLALALPVAFALVPEVRAQCSNQAAFQTLDHPGTLGDAVGTSVAISGNLALVGDPALDQPLTDSGGARAYRWNGTSWVWIQTLGAPTPAAGQRLGKVVSVDGDQALVASKPTGAAGHLYAYEWNGTARAFVHEVVPSSGHWEFGRAVDMEGDRAVVAGDDSVFIFRRIAGAWIEEQFIPDPHPAGLLEDFGCAVSLSGDSVLIGAMEWPQEPCEGPPDWCDYYGSAHVFRRTGTTWAHEATFQGLHTNGDVFGIAVGISGDRALVGAAGVNLAFAYWRTGTSWSPSTTIVPPPNSIEFGRLLGIEGNRSAIAAPSSSTLHFYEEVAGAWTFAKTSGGYYCTAQASLSVNGPWVLTGAPLAGYGGEACAYVDAIFVNCGATGSVQSGAVSEPFHTLPSGISAVCSGGRVMVRAGTDCSTSPLTINKPLTLVGYAGSATIR